MVLVKCLLGVEHVKEWICKLLTSEAKSARPTRWAVLNASTTPIKNSAPPFFAVPISWSCGSPLSLACFRLP